MLCLDFVNSRELEPGAPPSYAALVSWARSAGALAERDARRLARLAARRPAAADAVLARAWALRDGLRRVLSAVVDRRLARSSDLAVINAEIAGAAAASRLGPRGERFEWTWSPDGERLDRPLWPVARSAAELLASPLLAAVRACAAGGCGRLFVDRSRNRTRRWCDMSLCGNRAKARRHYARRRSRRARSAGGKS